MNVDNYRYVTSNKHFGLVGTGQVVIPTIDRTPWWPQFSAILEVTGNTDEIFRPCQGSKPHHPVWSHLICAHICLTFFGINKRCYSSVGMWDLWWDKVALGRFSPSSSVSPAIVVHSTNYSTITLIYHPGKMYNRPICGRGTGAYTNLGDLQRDLMGVKSHPTK
jgi:hypothetical protein